ncbi:MAG: type II secretion system protein GspK [Burkholderiaceae bacterium]
MTRPHIGTQPRGMVLIAVLWIVAALAVLVTGASHAVRDNVRIVSLARQSVVAQALGDGAIELVLQQMAALPTPLAVLSVVDANYRSTPISVEIVPVNGLIDVNAAPPPLLAALYRIAGGLAPPAAEALALATETVRTQKDARGRAIGFEAAEDLLRVPGLDYPLFARIAPLVTADLRGSGRVNPLAAPLPVLVVLAGGDLGKAQAIAAGRSAGRVGIDTTGLEAGFIDGGAGSRYRVRARVPLASGGFALIGRSVNLRFSAQSGLPWTTFRKSRRIEAVPDG